MPDYTVGVDLGGTKLLVAQVYSSGELGHTSSYQTAVEAGPRGILDQVTQAVARACAEGHPVAVGVGVPGIVDIIKGECRFSPNLHWQDVPVTQLLGAALGVPVYVDNDVNVAALAEHRLGAGRGYLDLIMATVGTGIGAGLILDDRLYRGPGGSAGELGHLPVDPEGVQCSCGQRGCLETTCSGTAIGRRATQLVHPDSLMWEHQPLDARAVFAAARQGDELARAVVQEAVEWLGTGLAGVVNLLNPRLIIVGGGVAQAGPGFLDALAAAIKARALPHPASQVQVVAAALGTWAGATGAGLYAWDRLKEELPCRRGPGA